MRADHEMADELAEFALRIEQSEAAHRAQEARRQQATKALEDRHQLLRETADRWIAAQSSHRPSDLPIEEHRAVFEMTEPTVDVISDQWHVAKHLAVLAVCIVGLASTVALIVPPGVIAQVLGQWGK